MKNLPLILVVVAILAALAGWYWYEQQNRTLLSVETPAGSLQVNENANGVSVNVNGQ